MPSKSDDPVYFRGKTMQEMSREELEKACDWLIRQHIEHHSFEAQEIRNHGRMALIREGRSADGKQAR